MQPYTAAEAAALVSRQVVVDYGLDLLNDEDQVVGDLTPDLAGGTVARSNYAAVHGTVDLTLHRALDWGTARVRPWQAVTGKGVTVRRNLGVYVLTTPDTVATDDDAPTYEVQGLDKLHLLQHEIGDTYVVPAGTAYLDAARQAITDAGVTGLPALFDGTAIDKATTAPLVWLLDTEDPATWLRVVNDLLAEIGYRGLWVDQDGRYRAEPYQSPAVRPVEWTHDLDDDRTNIVGPERTLTTDTFDRVTWWRFVQDDLGVQPVEGAGLYTVARPDGGPERRRVLKVRAADQAALVSIGLQEIDKAERRTRTLEITTGPLPILGHFDVSRIEDPDLGTLKVLTQSHEIPLDGGDVSLTLEVL